MRNFSSLLLLRRCFCDSESAAILGMVSQIRRGSVELRRWSQACCLLHRALPTALQNDAAAWIACAPPAEAPLIRFLSGCEHTSNALTCGRRRWRALPMEPQTEGPRDESIVGKLPAGALAGFDLPSSLCTDHHLSPEELARRAARQRDPRYAVRCTLPMASAPRACAAPH